MGSIYITLVKTNNFFLLKPVCGELLTGVPLRLHICINSSPMSTCQLLVVSHRLCCLGLALGFLP